MRLSVLLPRAIQKKILSARRARNHVNRIERQLAKLTELKWQYDEWSARWMSRQDRAASERAKGLLQAMYRIIHSFSRSRHREHVVAHAQHLGIPGFRLQLTRRANSRRRS